MRNESVVNATVLNTKSSVPTVNKTSVKPWFEVVMKASWSAKAELILSIWANSFQTRLHRWAKGDGVLQEKVLII